MGRSKFAAFLVSATLLAGCGTGSHLSSAPVSTSLGTHYRAPLPVTVPNLATGQVAGSPAAAGLQLLGMMRQNYLRCTGVEAEIKSYSQGHFKAGQHVDELRQGTSEANLVWSKPNKTRLTVVTSTNALLVGAAMATPDGQEITARAKGLLGLIPFHFSPTEPKLSNNRNHPFTENNPKTQLERLTSAAAVWTVVADSTIGGTPVKLVSVDGVKHLDHDITREVVAIDPAAGTLRAIVMYAGNTRVVDYQFLSFKWSPRITPDMFSL